jgi:transcriptional regulator with XRE-family HTH domain
MARPKGQIIDGRFIRSRRTSAGLTQDALAARCDMTRALIQKAERGGPLASASIAAIARALDAPESSLVLENDWNRSIAPRAVSSFRPDSVRRIGTAWGQSREVLHHMRLRQLLIVALRSVARVLPCYCPRNAAAAVHFQNIFSGVQCAHSALIALHRGGPTEGAKCELVKSADLAYLASAFARPAEFDEDCHAADAAFSIAIATARVADSLLLAMRADGDNMDANHWRAVEFATSACHAASQASIYLTVEAPFIRAATLDTHDTRNSDDQVEILTQPVWDSGQVPPPLRNYMDRLIRLNHFPHSIRVLWQRWANNGFV